MEGVSFMLNFEFRVRARKALQNHWQIALLIGLIAALPELLSQLVSALTGGSAAQRLTVLIENDMNILYSNERLASELQSILNDQGFRWSAILRVITWLVAPALSLGMTAYLLGLLRMQAGTVSSVFSRMKIWYKSIGLHIMTSLKAFLWALPGIAVTIAATFLLAYNVNSTEDLYSMVSWVNFLAYAGTLAAIIPMVLALLRYAMASMVLADEPSTGVMQAIRRSKEMMKHQKGNFFLLMLSFVGWYLLLVLLEILLINMVGYVLASTIYMVLSLALNIYITTTACAFYLNAKGESPVIVLQNNTSI